MSSETKLTPDVAMIVVNHFTPLRPRTELARALREHLGLGDPPRLDGKKGAQYLAALRFYEQQAPP